MSVAAPERQPPEESQPLSLAEKELRARHELAHRGQTLAFAALVLVLAAVVTLGLHGHDWLAGTIGGSYLVSVVGLFITGRYADNHAGG